MKKLLTKISIALIAVLIASSISAFPITHAEQSKAQEVALTFIENTLPVDLTKYSITFTKQSTLQMPFGSQLDIVRYTLSSSESTVNIICDIQNNVLRSCQVSEENGSINSDKQYDNLIDAVKSFLGKYQTYSKIDSTNLIASLDNVDVTKDSAITVGNTKLAITNSDSAEEPITYFNWAYTINGVNYTSLQLGFQKNGVLDTLYDNRALYTVGDTTVNISSEKAIEIAMKYLPSYSYEMPDHTFVSGFNITEDRTKTELVAYPIDSLELRPYWVVKLYLNQTYPGSVQGFTIYIWANSGELFSCTLIAIGGPDYKDSSDVEASLSPETTNSPSTIETNSPIPSAKITSSPLNTSLTIGIALAVIVSIIISIKVIKRKK